MYVEEPQSIPLTVELVLERLEGAEGIVAVTWEAVIRDGISADDDISVTRGELLFQSQERSKTFSIQVIYYTIILYTLLTHYTVYMQWNLLITAIQGTGQNGIIYRCRYIQVDYDIGSLVGTY